MRRLSGLILLCLVIAGASGCTSSVPIWRVQAQDLIAKLEQDGVALSYPDDYRSVTSTFMQGERLLIVDEDVERADEFHRLSYKKALLLNREAEQERIRQQEEAWQQEVQRQAIAAEEERQKREAEEIRQQERAAAEKAKRKNQSAQQNGTAERPSLPATHTVRRGETLPQVAARNEVYNDAALWPIIYRANRDQISDPHQLWPGQVLRIPRGFSREDAIEARKQAARRSR